MARPVDHVREHLLRRTNPIPDQRSAYEQVSDLINVAERRGFNDAADWLKYTLERWIRPLDIDGDVSG